MLEVSERTQPGAKIIADSISPWGDRLTTFEVVLHRSMLAELNTHRAFSRNSESSRAVPVDKKLQRFEEDPAMPVFWAAERPGMTVVEELDGQDLADAMVLFGRIQESTYELIAQYLATHPEKGTRLHKGLLNRPLEWALWQTVLISTTTRGLENFFVQRCSPLAQPEIRVVAEAMQFAYQNGMPQKVQIGGWHLPYVTDEEREQYSVPVQQAISAARCARVSTGRLGDERPVEQDLERFESLIKSTPPHPSPLEHQATPKRGPRETPGNFDGWTQLRHILLPS